MAFKVISASEAASMIKDGMNVGFSGFTAAGSPKAIACEIAKIAEKEHAEGKPFKIGVLTGASTGDSLDGNLARAKAVRFRTPYQSNGDTRKALNNHEMEYVDYHLSHLAQDLRYGFFGKIDIAVVEACEVTENGEIYLTSSVGVAPTYCQMADKLIIELNSTHPKALKGFHDIYTPLDPPLRREIPIYAPTDRIGTPYVKVDPAKIAAVVYVDKPDEVGGFAEVDGITAKIGENVANFLAKEYSEGRIPKEFLPLQSGVGNIANAVLAALDKHPGIPPFQMYTEVIQDSVIDLMKSGKCTFASTCAFTLSQDAQDYVYHNLDFFRDKLVLRPGEITNHPEIVRRLGLITMNTALEADIYGNVNSTHVVGTKMMNGIGGSADFTRNAYISIFTTPSTAKNGKISAIVPMVSHVDHSEHSVKVLVTEYGVADLRGKSPRERAEAIIENCVHPDYRPKMREYLSICDKNHTAHNMNAALAFHTEFLKSGDMSKTDFEQYR